MKVSLDGLEQAPGHKLDRQLRIGKEPSARVDAVAFDANAATRRYKRSLWWTYGFIYAALVIGFILSLGKANNGAAVLIMLVIVLGFAVLIAYFHRKEIAKWRARAASRLAELPPAGTKASGDAIALTIDGKSYPWATLKIDAVEFVKKASKRNNWFEVDRIRVSAQDGASYVLDVFGYQNGNKLIDLAAHKLWPQIAPVTRS